MTELRLVVSGAGGRMGQSILREAQGSAGVAIAGAIEQSGHALVGSCPPCVPGVEVSDRLDALVAGGGVMIDFTTPAASLALARFWAGAGHPLVIGTTGFSAAGDADIASLASRAAIVKSGNMSLGVNFLAAMAKKAAAILGADYDIEIVDAHHRAKIDAPSGTALMLASAAAEGRGVRLDDALVTARGGARAHGAIGVAVIRGGGVIGDHDVMFAGSAEIVTLSHRALDRSLFAKGAIAAARWVANKPPGLYSMADVLDL